MRIILVIILALVQISISAQNIHTLSSDGAWCWFSAPGAIYRHNGEPEIVTGWVTQNGSIEAALLNLKTGQKSIQNVSPRLDKDDHANPSFVELINGDVLMSYTKHFDAHVRFNRLLAKSDIAEFGQENGITVYNDEQFKLYPRKCVTYSNPIQLKKENGRLYVFGRWTGYKPNVMWSDDNGITFNNAQVYITNQPFNDDNRPYVRYYSNGQSKIHIVFTDGHPRKEPNNSIYYACYENGAFWRADGSKICDLENIPFEPKDASVIYKATEQTGRAWVFDVSEDKKGNPVVLYARYPTVNDHIYQYATLDKNEWLDEQICHSGKWFPQTPEGAYEREPHYSAGMTFHSSKPNTIYLSRNINGVFEIEKRTTSDRGKTWTVTPITQNSKYDNVRPVMPKNAKRKDKAILLWMVNEKYIHYTDYKTRIDYTIE